MSKVRQVSEAIGRIEGFFAQGNTLPKRLNNPGDLLFKQQSHATPYNVYVPVKQSDGSTKQILHIFAKFDTLEHGWEACDRQVHLFAGRIDPKTRFPYTVAGTIQVWAPKDDGNDPVGYTALLCKAIGCKPGDYLREVLKDGEV